MKDCSRADCPERGGRGIKEFGRTVLSLVSVFLAVGAIPTVLAGQTVPPHEEYRTLETENFRVTFPEGLEEVGRSAAIVAERAHAALRESFLRPPSGPIDLLVTDHSDLSSGFAEVFPSNRMFVWVQPPLDGFALSHFDQWLELVITHELTHVFHLDRSGPIGTGVRAVFGRVPWTWPAYPAYTTSFLGIEGVATHLESAHTRAGRVHGNFQEAVVRTQALGGGAESVAQGLGRSPLWPAGDRPYVLGSLFFRHLSDTYGEPAVVEFFRAMANLWVPYRLDAAARETFGSSFQDLWSEWISGIEFEANALRVRIEGSGQSVEPELLTEAGRWALHPAPGPDSRGLAYVRADGRSDPQVILRTAGGERALTRWNSLDRPAWLSDGSLLLPQPEYFDTYRVYRDLFRVALDGEVTRLTRGLRVVHADPHPKRDEIVAVLPDGEANRLVILGLDGTVLRVLENSEPGVLWSLPRWSPDGERVAVVRRRPGGWTAVLVVDIARGSVQQILEDRSLNNAPAWSPDGEMVLWSSDRSGLPNLYAARADGAQDGSAGAPGLRQVTDLTTGGTFPSVDRAGEWIYLSVLSDDGWEIGRVPFNPSSWFDPLPIDPRYDGVGPEGSRMEQDSGRREVLAGTEIREYSAIQTLFPRYWLPIRVESESALGTEVLPVAWGARTSGSDLVGRHEYDLRLAMPFDARRGRTEWGAQYAWAGLGNPIVVLETGQEWASRAPFQATSGGNPPQAAPNTLLSILRERWVGSALEFRRQRMRSAGVLSVGSRFISQRRRVLEVDGVESERFEPLRPSSSLAEVRLSIGLSTARGYPFSVSTENGIALSVGLRQRWDRSVPDSLIGQSGVDGALREMVGSLRGYRGISGPGYSNHVFGFRAVVGAADGPGTGSGHFSIGGGGGDGRGVLGFTFGSPFRRFPVRGVSAGTVRGDRVWALSGEWRFPLAMIHTGLGAWPLHVDRVAGAIFVDAAGADRDVDGEGTQWETVSSVGAEIVVFGSLLFEAVDRVRFGVALPMEDPTDSAGHASVYLQTGWSF